MSSAKVFLLGFLAVYVVLAGGGQVVFGPPGYTAEYMAEHKDAHERYLGITKSQAYKQYTQQGDAVDPEPEMEDQVEFVAAYEATPEFQAEARRRTIYGYYFGFLNAGSLFLVAFRFGRGPIASLLDSQIAEIRSRLQQAEEAKAQAEERLQSAQARIDGLGKEEEQARRNAKELMAREHESIQEGTDHAIAFIDQETEDRKRIAEQQAVKALRKELVELAKHAAADEYVANRTPETETAEIESFVAGLTGQPAQESVPK